MYADFQLCIGTGEAPGPFPVEVVSSPAGPAGGQMMLPEGFDEQLAALRSVAAEPNALRRYGSMLFDALFSGEIRKAFDTSLNLGRKEGGLRIHLQIDDPTLEQLPWETLYDGRSFLATDPHLLISRYRMVSQPPSFSPTGKLRVLAVFEDPETLGPTPPGFESSLAELATLGVESQVLKNASPQEIRSTAQEGFQVLHVVAHSMGSMIALLGEGLTPSKTVDDKEYAEFLGRRVRLPLVVLDACQSGEGAGRGAYAGLATSLVRNGVRAVIGMQYPFVRPDSARIFTRALYESLADGLPVDAALKEARRMLWFGGHLDQPDWSSPILYLGDPSASSVGSSRVVTGPGSSSAVPQESHSTPRHADPDGDHPQDASSPQAKVCEEFQGFVEKIEDDKAYVRLDSQRGERLCGPYPAHELIELGIRERDRFILRTIDRGRDVRIEITPVPRVQITPERQREIEERVERMLGDFDPSDDY